MKIAQICYLFSPAVGGVETHVLKVSSRLIGWGHEVDVLTSDFLALNGFDRVVRHCEVIEGIKVLRFKGFYTKRTKVYAQKIKFPGLFWKLIFGGYDVIHCHSIASLHFDLAWLASKILRKPLVVTGHYSPNDLDRLWTKRRSFGCIKYWTARLLFWKTWMTFALRRTDRVIAIAESEKMKMIEYLGLRDDQVSVIPNGVDPDEFDAVAESEVKAFRDKRNFREEPIVLFVGRISKVKGPDILVDSAINLLKTGVNARFLVIGHSEDPELRADLIERTSAAGLADRFSFEDLPRREVVTAFKACDIVVLPSRGEVFGIVLVEGMYCGKIVIGSDSGGIPEVIQDGETGFLFRNEDSKDLERVLRNAIVNLSRFGEMGLAAKRSVLDKYTWKSSAEKLLRIYNELI